VARGRREEIEKRAEQIGNATYTHPNDEGAARKSVAARRRRSRPRWARGDGVVTGVRGAGGVPKVGAQRALSLRDEGRGHKQCHRMTGLIIRRRCFPSLLPLLLMRCCSVAIDDSGRPSLRSGVEGPMQTGTNNRTRRRRCRARGVRGSCSRRTRPQPHRQVRLSRRQICSVLSGFDECNLEVSVDSLDLHTKRRSTGAASLRLPPESTGLL
jgi:hypothetical protein